MNLLNKKEAIILFLGDILFLIISLWLMLSIRYFALPNLGIFNDHLIPFSILFIFWIFIFWIAGLYEKHTLIIKKTLSKNILNTQIINSVIAIIFFYFIPYFGINPKTNLFLYLIISFSLILLWRLKLFNLFTPKNRHKAILIGSGDEMQELKHEVNNNERYDFYFDQSIDLNNYDVVGFEEDVVKYVYENNISIIVCDVKNPASQEILPQLYNLIFAKVHFLDLHKVYETLFNKIPLSMIGYNWFLENISSKKTVTYDFLKRVMDIILSVFIGFGALFITPIVIYLIRKDEGSSIFFVANRIGKNGKNINLYKFRTMTEGVSRDDEKKVTKIGRFLRKTRIDELPQIINVFKGDLSLIGPRPENIDLVNLYSNQVPYYNVRHLIKPGLSGWAQIYHHDHPHHKADIQATKEKLSYDLFYIKNRSILLDLKIAMKTVKTIFTQKGK